MIWEALNTIYVKPVYYKSQKKFSKAHVARDGTLKNQPNKVGTTPQYFYTIPTSCAILPSITCVHRRVVLGMEGCVMSSIGCVVHVVVYGEWVVLWLAPSFVAIERGRHD